MCLSVPLVVKSSAKYLKLIGCTLLLYLSFTPAGCHVLEYDSLLARYLNESLPATTRLRALNFLGETNFIHEYPDSLLHYHQGAHTLFEEKGATIDRLKHLYQIGKSHDGAGRYSEVNEYYLQSYKIAEETEQWRFAGLILLNIGENYFETGLVDLAQDYLYRGLYLAKQYDYQPAIVRGHVLLTRFYQQSRADSALYYGEKALALAHH